MGGRGAEWGVGKGYPRLGRHIESQTLRMKGFQKESKFMVGILVAVC